MPTSGAGQEGGLFSLSFHPLDLFLLLARLMKREHVGQAAGGGCYLKPTCDPLSQGHVHGAVLLLCLKFAHLYLQSNLQTLRGTGMSGREAGRLGMNEQILPPFPRGMGSKSCRRADSLPLPGQPRRGIETKFTGLWEESGGL